MPYVLLCPACLMPYVLSYPTYLVPYVLLYSLFLTYTGVSSLTTSFASHVSQLSCLVPLLLKLFEFFIVYFKVNHCDMPFLKMERLHNGFMYNWYTSPGFINLTTLTNFMPLVFCSLSLAPENIRKPLVFRE